MLNHALTIMNSAVSGQAPPPPSIPIYSTNANANPRSFIPPPPPEPTNNNNNPKGKIEEMSFKEVVEKYAESNGLMLMPSKKRYEGKQVYNFGEIPIVLEKEMIYRQVKPNNEWKPTSLEDLLQQ